MATAVPVVAADAAVAVAADDGSSGGARSTSSASTRSTTSTTKMLTAYASSSAIAARSYRAVIPVLAPSIKGFSNVPSSVPAISRCSPSPAQASQPVVGVRCGPAATDRPQGQLPWQNRPLRINQPLAAK